MKNDKPLLAKSYDHKKFSIPPDYALLTQHSRDVAEACSALADSVGMRALQSLGLNAALFNEFKQTLILNGWLQDLGKANSHFQEMVSNNSNSKQLLRHETISGLIVWFLLRERLLEKYPETLLMSLWGAIGHHRKFHNGTMPDETVGALNVYVSRPDFKAILIEMCEQLGLSKMPEFSNDIIITRTKKEGGDWAAIAKLDELTGDFDVLKENFELDEKRRLLGLVKGLGISADVAASAIAARGKWASEYSLSKFINESFEFGLQPKDIRALINTWAWSKSSTVRSLNEKTSLPPNFKFREFQNNVGAAPSLLSLAKAGCGSGKSIAAYLWAESWCVKAQADGRTNFRLFFCLPTTGTTTEHFKDYALESGIDSRFKSLTHSRSRVDLKAIAETAVQEESNSEYEDAFTEAQAALNAERAKIESLALWSTPLVVTTADTILGLMANARRGIFALPSIVNSAIVFDEIHAFDNEMFGHLLMFRKNFIGIPVLLMTASLPEERLKAIAAVRPDFNLVTDVIAGPPEFELLERYLIEEKTSETLLWQAVEDCLKANGKVLWVRNRVNWANRTFNDCCKYFESKFPDCAINIYHSRFRYKDRSDRHRRVIDDFKRDGQSAILVATQVAEMSLDLSADLLITDFAPIPSLIQRLGRLNRKSTPENPLDAKPAILCRIPIGGKNPFLPYDEKEISAASEWAKHLRTKNSALNQYQLSEAFKEFCQTKDFDIETAEENAKFFSGIWETQPGKTRSPGYTMSVLLEQDKKACDQFDAYGGPTKDWLREHEVSIPIKDAAFRWELFGGLRVAPSDQVHYDYNDETKEGTGATWIVD
jgi:CRISPR-associated endonuclease/helicase Cas3